MLPTSEQTKCRLEEPALLGFTATALAVQLRPACERLGRGLERYTRGRVIPWEVVSAVITVTILKNDFSQTQLIFGRRNPRAFHLEHFVRCRAW